MYPYRSGSMIVPKDLYTIEWEVNLVNTNPINTAGGSWAQYMHIYPNGLYWADSEEHAKEHYFRNNPAISEEDIISIVEIDPSPISSLGFSKRPSIIINSTTGFGAELIPVMKYNVQYTGDSLGDTVVPLVGITSVIDCPPEDHVFRD